MSIDGESASSPSRSDEKVTFGGLDGASGGYCLPPCGFDSLPDLLRGFRPRGISRILKAGLDPLDLGEAGWGVVWPSETPDAVRDALAPLLSRRHEQAGPLLCELETTPEESALDFLERYDSGPDTVDPRKVPYYLLIIGPPGVVPFDLQTELGVSRAVGRIAFESADGYAEYVEHLVGYERRRAPDPRTMTFFGVENQDDPLTRSAVEDFVKHLELNVAQRRRDWKLETLLRHAATKARLKELLVKEGAPSLLFTVGHAVRYRRGSQKQATHQGALVCADWPGPELWKGQGPMSDSHMLTASDVSPGADLSGLIALLVACYSAGTPRLDAYGFGSPEALADEPFVSPLPRTLLRRGALAVIGHVDLALEQSFLWYDAGPQSEAFASVLYELTAGYPVGFAFRYLSQRYAELAVYAARSVRKALQGTAGGAVSWRDFHHWAAYEDARNYVLLGDPAARLHI